MALDRTQATTSARPEAAGETLRRTATIAVGLPIFLAALIRGGWPWQATLAVLAVIGAWEWVRLARAAGQRAAPEVALPGAALLVVAAPRPELLAGIAALLVVAALVAQMVPSRRPQAVANAGVTLLGAGYPALLAALALIRRGPNGLAYALLVVAAVWAADAAAYVGGMAVGRRRLAPSLSPGKTWEGVASGVLAAAAAAWIVAAAFALPLGPAVALGLLAAVAGLVGDLAESALKRAARVKDAGALLPGHGGVLDRFDAMLFGAPAVLIALRWVQ